MYFYRNTFYTFFFSGYLYINLFLNNQQAMVFGGRGWGGKIKYMYLSVFSEDQDQK